MKNPISLVGKPDKNRGIEDNDRLMNYLRNFIKSNKIKNSTNYQKEKEKMIHKLKDFLVYLEDKNLINSKIQDTKQLRVIVDQILNKESKMGHFYDNRRKSNPANDSYNFGKIYENKNFSLESDSRKSKKKGSQRLIFQQARSERGSNERSNYEPPKNLQARKRSLGSSKLFMESEKNFTPSKLIDILSILHTVQ